MARDIRHVQKPSIEGKMAVHGVFLLHLYGFVQKIHERYTNVVYAGELRGQGDIGG